jgi:hypothetical protein
VYRSTDKEWVDESVIREHMACKAVFDLLKIRRAKSRRKIIGASERAAYLLYLDAHCSTSSASLTSLDGHYGCQTLGKRMYRPRV